MSTGSVARNTRIDALRMLCAQCIVLHHFAAYGPLSDALEIMFPIASAWMFDYGRLAVQVFLVLSGYMAARTLEPVSRGNTVVLFQALWKRYRRLILPLLAALVLAVVSAAMARHWLTDEFVPGPPNLLQGVAHALLLQDALGFDALSVGVWYVAIDFQLYVLLAFVFWTGCHVRPLRHLPKLLVAGLMLLSLFVINREPQWDNWAPYFFGAYAMGVLIAWAQRSRHAREILAGLVAVVAMALIVEFRVRLVIALGAALALLWLTTGAGQLPKALERWVSLLGQSSYALFLTHFSVVLLINVLFLQWHIAAPTAVAGMLLAGMLLSNGLGVVFARYVEAPLSGWFERR
jgi:peptidoglycan/LPS O-acetylase OafA/YrhL